MKIIVTGSLGYVSTPLIEQLVEGEHQVTVISSKADRLAAIEAMGAEAAIGSMEDVDFLTDTFTGADAAYCMLAPGGDFTDPANTVASILQRANEVTNNYVQAIGKSGVKRVVYLSTIGAHADKDTGLLLMHHNAENTLRALLPADVAISFMRPVGFYKNLFGYIGGIKAMGAIASNYGGDDLALLVSNIDIATAIAEELTASEPELRKIRYIASEERSCNEVAGILGAAIGKPDLKWIVISDEQLLGALKNFMNESIAASFVEMNANIRSGLVYEDYLRHRPTLGATKLTEFAKEFAAAYHAG